MLGFTSFSSDVFCSAENIAEYMKFSFTYIFGEIFVALKPTSAPQYVTICIFCGTLRNTHKYTAAHHTPCILLALSFISLVRQMCDNSGGMKWPIIAEIYLKSSNFSLYGSWSDNGRWGRGKLPAFSIKFRTQAS
jgi:hypothetical protein